MKNTTQKTKLEVVKEIHGKILVSSEACLAEAQAILNSATEANTNLYQKMLELGFGKVKDLAQQRDKIEKTLLAKETAELILQYKVKYPNNKFITADALDKICKEYNLILGSHHDYEGEMPIRSMKAISEFKLRPEDELYYEGKAVLIEPIKLDKTKALISWAEISKEQYDLKTDNGKIKTKNGNRLHYVSNKDYFVLMAPETMFDLKGKVVENGKIKEVIEVLDPAALKTVKGGYLIVALWGEEMAIKEMQNETLN